MSDDQQSGSAGSTLRGSTGEDRSARDWIGSEEPEAPEGAQLDAGVADGDGTTDAVAGAGGDPATEAGDHSAGGIGDAGDERVGSDPGGGSEAEAGSAEPADARREQAADVDSGPDGVAAAASTSSSTDTAESGTGPAAAGVGGGGTKRTGGKRDPKSAEQSAPRGRGARRKTTDAEAAVDAAADGAVDADADGAVSADGVAGAAADATGSADTGATGNADAGARAAADAGATGNTVAKAAAATHGSLDVAPTGTRAAKRSPAAAPTADAADAAAEELTAAPTGPVTVRRRALRAARAAAEGAAAAPTASTPATSTPAEAPAAKKAAPTSGPPKARAATTAADEPPANEPRQVVRATGPPRRPPLLVQGLWPALLAGGLIAATVVGLLPLAVAVLGIQVFLVLGALALLDAPAAGGAFLVAVCTIGAADLVVLSDDGRIGGLAGVVGLGLVASLLHQLVRKGRSRVTESLADTLVVIVVSVAAACLLALRQVEGGEQVLLVSLAAAGAVLLAGRIGDQLAPRPMLAVGSTRGWPGLLLGLGAGVAVSVLVADAGFGDGDLPLRSAALLGLVVASTVATADLAVDLGAAELRAGWRDARRVAALRPTALLLPYAVLGPVALLAGRLVLA